MLPKELLLKGVKPPFLKGILEEMQYKLVVNEMRTAIKRTLAVHT